MLLSMHRAAESLEMFTEALNVFKQADPESEAVGENHYCIAEALHDKGDSDGALQHSQESKKIREKLHGLQHPKTIDSYQQMGKLLSAQYAEYTGVMTAQIKKQLQVAITCYERVFKFMKTTSPKDMTLKKTTRAKESILLTLVRTLIGLKLRLIPAQHKELVQSLRASPEAYTSDAVKDVMMQLIHLSPTVLLEGIFQRLEDQDKQAVSDLGIILNVAESASLTFA
jgi:tetratricopeptide (TPR) repeat protein